jgi:hypothetical protein
MSPLMCRVPDAGHARRSRRHPGRRPEAAKERTRGLFCELCPFRYGDLSNADCLLVHEQRALIGSTARIIIVCIRVA